MTEELLDPVAEAGECDLIEALAHPLATEILSELVGVPRADRGWLRPLIVDITAALEAHRRLDDARRARDSRQKVREYVKDLVDQRRAEPEDDLLSAMIQARDGEVQLTAQEVAATVSLIYGVGFETTASLIGSIAHTLMRWPGQLDRLRSDRSLVPAAVEEVLRFEPPVQVDGRYAFSDVEVAGRVISAGHAVLICWGPPTATRPRWRTRPLRRRAGRVSAAVVRCRHSSVPWSGAGPPGGRGDAAGPARPVRNLDAPGRQSSLASETHPSRPGPPPRRLLLEANSPSTREAGVAGRRPRPRPRRWCRRSVPRPRPRRGPWWPGRRRGCG